MDNLNLIATALLMVSGMILVAWLVEPATLPVALLLAIVVAIIMLFVWVLTADVPHPLDGE